jgi:hypothetical protein
MKPKIQLLIGIIIGLAVGFAAGLFTGHVRNTSEQRQVVALKQPSESPQLQLARSNLNQLRLKFTDETPLVKRQQDLVRLLEEKGRVQ